MYRPGVALRDLGVPDKDEDEDGDGDSGERKGLRSVLVAQVCVMYLYFVPTLVFFEILLATALLLRRLHIQGCCLQSMVITV